MQTLPNQQKNNQRAQLQADIDKFLSAGGQVRQCAAGESAIVNTEAVAKIVATAKQKRERDIAERKVRREREKQKTLKRDPSCYELMGKKFGMLTVIGIGKNSRGIKAWVCECECGFITPAIPTAKLLNGERVSCGCKRKKRSGENGS